MSPNVISTRRRARQACLHCNRRRIKCTVAEKHPCENCISMNVPCEVGISKRGKYPRKKNLHQAPVTPSSTVAAGTPQLVNHEETPYDRHKSGCHDKRTPHHTPLPGSTRNPDLARIPRVPRSPWISPEESINTSQPTVFLGESSPLTCVVDEGQRSPDKAPALGLQKTRLHYTIPERLDSTSMRDEALRAHKARMETRLQEEEAFSYPSEQICAALLKAYFDWFHPCFPVLDRGTVQKSYADGSISPLLLQAILFIGVSLCTDAVLSQTGLPVRYRAKFMFYSRAKAIYDADWEANKTVKLQSLFLLSFWRGGPSEERDTRFWLGVSISLAQKRGMHVMAKFSFHSPREEKLWKRIWWSIYTRDQQSATALGLPPRIRDEDCDVAMLEASDVYEEESVDDAHIFGSQCAAEADYPVEIAKLARILRNIVTSQYGPMTESVSDPSSRAALHHQQLCDWEANVPRALKDANSSPKGIFLSSLLHMTYNNLYILLYRPSFLNASNSEMEKSGQVALDAATRSCRIIEDMLSHNLVQHGPPHLITHTFSALCIQTIHSRRTTSTTRKLAEHRARLCLLGLHELQKTWDLENFVLRIFFRCLDDSTARTLQLEDHAESSQARQTESQSQSMNEPQLSQRDEGPDITMSSNTDPTLAPSLPTLAQGQGGDVSAPSDWYGLFNFTDDYTDIFGSSPTQEPLNLHNLEFLYRFL